MKKLIHHNHEVVIFDNGFRVGFDNVENMKNIQQIKGNVANLEDWNQLPSDIEQVFHLAAINGTKYFYEIPEKILEVNVGGTLNLFKWIPKTQVKKIFFASSSEVYGFPNVFPTPESETLCIPNSKNPRFSYSSSKIIGETITINFCKSLGIDYLIGRFHNVYGPKMGFEHVIPEFIRKCVKNEPFTVQGDGNETRSFCYIDDAIAGILCIANNSNARNDIFNIGTCEEVSINDLIKKLESIHGSSILPIYKEFKNAGTKRRVPDITKIENIGYKPLIPLVNGLELTYNWYKEYYLNSSN
ncbi:MAG: NAD-dependent epimerase/dehydratase family protein [Nitrosarchaeum sp.]|nr:NAD-dependent epimerase/dehydratase family protein [Nitrosarchaeum sp.]